MGKPKWKQLLDEKFIKANKMAEEFREMGLNCAVDKFGDIVFSGADLEKFNQIQKERK